MKPFTIETPVLRFKECCDEYVADSGEVVCKHVLAKLFYVSWAETISFKISTRKSAAAIAMSLEVGGCNHVYWHYVNGVYVYTTDGVNNWLCKHTPLGDLKPGESATVYVTLYVHEEK